MLTRDEARRKQILDAAQEVFAEKSFAGASIKDLARAAGVSPGLLYWYFKDKADLFSSLLAERMAVAFGALTEQVSLELPPEEFLPRFGRFYVGLFEQPMNAALFKTVIANTTSFPPGVRQMQSRVIGHVLRTLQDYFQCQIELGRIRPCNTEMVTRTFMGGLMGFLLLRHILQDERAQELEIETVVDGVADVVLRGILPGK